MHPVRNSSGTFDLFVYGTLKRGGCRHGPLVSQRFLGEVQTTPQYRLYDLGDYPGLVAVDHDGQVVKGELYEVDCGLVSWLDATEGAPSWFDLGPVYLAGRERPAWAYYFQQDTRGRSVVAGGCWVLPGEPERNR